MADSLDDFFAKKDKSKKKSRSRFVAADLLPVSGTGSAGTTGNVETDDAKKTRKKKDRDQSGAQSSGAANATQEDGDWNDYELEEEKDYSGLRIQHLQSKAENDEAEDDGREPEYNEDGDIVQRRDEVGPWNKGQGSQPPIGVSAADSADSAASEAIPAGAQAGASASTAAAAGTESSRAGSSAAQTSGGKYVPPSLRRAGAASASGAPSSTPLQFGGSRLKKKTAPNITSEEDFPSLGGFASERPIDTDTTSFEKVKGGGKDRDSSAAAPKLELANKFDALSF